MKQSRFNAILYTQGRFGKRLRETLDTDNPYLYSFGQYPTKITAEMLPEEYLQIRSRSIWYMTGYLRTSGIVDIKYRWSKWNHLFKDDYLYLSYDKPIEPYIDEYGFERLRNWQARICGYDIMHIILAAEKYSGYDTTELRKQIEEKRVFYRDNHPDDYAREVGEDIDLLRLWAKNGW